MTARPFSSVLVANRGEIAVRVVDEARLVGKRAIAVYSDADARALHVRRADEAVRIGPAAAAESYLNIDAVLDAARKTGAEAIHPGYGFLAENADFARAVIDAGMVWIGPPPEAIEAMGDKARAKQLMIGAEVPTLPGWQGKDQSDANLAAQAETVGYPLLIKAVAGGGGRGMRIVRQTGEFAEALASARREAKSAFGDDAVLLERFVERGRHVEIQVFADTHGNTIHLHERDCSAQRRRQKVIEEAPSPAVDEALRARMGVDAVAAAKAVDYVGAGTVEFLLDDDGNYFFLEMNTRLQVEHPVTEEVICLPFDPAGPPADEHPNLVRWQFDVAAGAALSHTQDDISSYGHAIELRLCAEDPDEGFTPQSGRLEQFCTFGLDHDVRIDEGYRERDQVSSHYDSMMAKIIAHGHDRAQAISRLEKFLQDEPIFGVKTNREFLLRLLAAPEFVAGEIRTDDLDRWSEAGEGPFKIEPPSFHLVAVAASILAGTRRPVLRSASVRGFSLELIAAGEAMSVSVEQLADGGVQVTNADGETHRVWCSAGLGGRHLRRRRGKVQIDGVESSLEWSRFDDGSLSISLRGEVLEVREASPWSDASASDPSKIAAPVSGAVVAVNVKPGDTVKTGDVVAVMEAMKMEMRLTAEADGAIAAVHAAEGDQASGGFVLIELDLQSED